MPLTATASLTRHEPGPRPWLDLADIHTTNVSRGRVPERFTVVAEAVSSTGWTVHAGYEVVPSAAGIATDDERVIDIQIITAPNGHREALVSTHRTKDPARSLGSQLRIPTLLTDWDNQPRRDKYLATEQDHADLADAVHDQWSRVERLHALSRNTTGITNGWDDPHRWQQDVQAIHWAGFPSPHAATPWVEDFAGDAGSAEDYFHAGLTPETALMWSQAHVLGAAVSAWVAAGWSATQAVEFSALLDGLNPDWSYLDRKGRAIRWQRAAKRSGQPPENVILGVRARLTEAEWDAACADPAFDWDAIAALGALCG